MNKKEINISKFIEKISSELEDFKESQLIYSSQSTKTMEEWVENFLFFSGYSEEREEMAFEEHDDDLYYGDIFQFEEVINRKKYKSWKEDDAF
jgi:predicted translin family RNA/ssDNA-binding protein